MWYQSQSNQVWLQFSNILMRLVIKTKLNVICHWSNDRCYLNELSNQELIHILCKEFRKWNSNKINKKNVRNQTSVLPIRRLRPKTQFSHVFEQKSLNKFRLYFMINHNQMANIFVLIRNVQATGTPIGGVLSHCAISQTIQFIGNLRLPCVYIYLCFLSLNRRVTSMGLPTIINLIIYLCTTLKC